MNVSTANMDFLVKQLDVASVRHRVIAHNVANVNTPGFRQLDVNFENALEQRLNRGDAAGSLRIRPEIVEGQGGPERADGNNIDIDQEMGRLTKNTLLYRTYAQILAVKLAAMRSAINGR